MNNRKILLFSRPAMLSACSGPRLPPGQYKLGLRDTYERLAKGDFNDFKFERHCGILINIASQGQRERCSAMASKPELASRSMISPASALMK